MDNYEESIFHFSSIIFISIVIFDILLINNMMF